jgi:hypothetical protein
MQQLLFACFLKAQMMDARQNARICRVHLDNSPQICRHDDLIDDSVAEM